MTVAAILAAIAGLLALVSIFPAAEKFPLLSVATLLLAIAIFVMKGG